MTAMTPREWAQFADYLKAKREALENYEANLAHWRKVLQDLREQEAS